jgi:hypothetical protein
MFCCFRPPTTQDDATAKGAQLQLHQQHQQQATSDVAASSGGSITAARAAAGAVEAVAERLHSVAGSRGKPPPGRRSNSLGSNPLAISHQQQQQQDQALPAAAAGLGGPLLEPLARLGEGAALQAAGLTADAAGTAGSAAAAGAAGGDNGGQGGVLQLVALLQELLALSTACPRQPLSRAMSLLVLRLPVDWACLHAISSSGRVVMQVGRRTGGHPAVSQRATGSIAAAGACSAIALGYSGGRCRQAVLVCFSAAVLA